MKITSPTPGPYHSTCFAVYAGSQQVAHTGGCLPNNRVHEAEANATFFAATWDLHEACKTMLGRLQQIIGENGTFYSRETAEKDSEIILSALEKAIFKI